MLEKCVRAIADDVGPTRQDCERVVRAILNELKQVDEGMTIAVSEALQGDFWIGPTAAAKVIRAHIDHVLREGEGK